MFPWLSISARSIKFVSVYLNNFSRVFGTTDQKIEQYYDVGVDLAKKAGELVSKMVIKQKFVETKTSAIDLVTETDKEVENLLFTELSARFPTHKLIGEENVSAGNKVNLTDVPTWVIDPIDGTMNFIHAFPHSCVSIALFISSKPVVGIIYNPSLNQLFTAKKGQGAYLNEKPIMVSPETQLQKALIMFETGNDRSPEKMKSVYENYRNLVPHIQGIRMLGSAALNMAMVASGCAEAYFEYGVHIWDTGAGELIVKEAGGVVLDPAGGQLDPLSRRMICANNGEIASQIISKLKQFYPPRD